VSIAEREGTEKEILSELVYTVGWSAVLDGFKRQAKSLKAQVFNAPTPSEMTNAVFAHNAIKQVVYSVYARAGVPVPRHVREIFD
jgi:hypothetical protein